MWKCTLCNTLLSIWIIFFFCQNEFFSCTISINLTFYTHKIYIIGGWEKNTIWILLRTQKNCWGLWMRSPFECVQWYNYYPLNEQHFFLPIMLGQRTTIHQKFKLIKSELVVCLVVDIVHSFYVYCYSHSCSLTLTNIT